MRLLKREYHYMGNKLNAYIYPTPTEYMLRYKHMQLTNYLTTNTWRIKHF